MNRQRLARLPSAIARWLGLARSPLEPHVSFFQKLAQWPASRRKQRDALRELHLERLQKLVIFFTPGIQRVKGGVLQIYALHRLTREFFRGTGTDAVICWLPGSGWHAHRSEGFKNEVTVFPVEMVLDALAPDCRLLFHVPEFALGPFCERIGWARLRSLRETRRLQFNILNQNIERKPDTELVLRLKDTVQDLTCTLPNLAWIEGERQRLRGIPQHLLPTWYYPDDAPWQPYESKRNLMMLSPDVCADRERVIAAIRRALPNLEFQLIQRMKYEDYLEFERAAKWSLTFGEGLDGFFYGPVFRGGVSFAVRNNTFDVPGFEDLRTIYPDYDTMAQRIAADIAALDRKEAYEACNRTIRAPLLQLMGRERTWEALAAFYRGEWSHP